ncbi:right-handed parallel beta-helix repeat-containing protein [bacterium]|nr:right-handed parallel beta-helix repeat-containing protein [bacterium]
MTTLVRCLLPVFLLLMICGSSFGDVYVNMLWDEPTSSFKVKPLVLEGGAYFDRGYQNAYGEYLGLDPGPPFIIQSSIIANGTVTFASGGFDPMRPFDIQVYPNPLHSGRLTAGQGVNFLGTWLDPIHIEGIWQIDAGIDYQDGGSEMVWSYTLFDCTYSDDQGNGTPFEISGLSLRAENCRMRNLSNDFFSLMSVNDFDPGSPEYEVSFRNCTFENLDFLDRMWRAINLSNLRSVSIEGCRFDNVDITEYDGGGIVCMHTCGITSIKNNVSVHCNDSKMRMIDTWAVDSAYVESSDKLPIIANDIVVPADGALTIGKGSVIKFLVSGGLDVAGRLWVDSTVLTSWEDDEYGGNTDLEPQPDPFIGNWEARGSGIWIDTTGSAEIRRSLIRYPRSGIHARGPITLDSVTIENSWYTGLALRCPHAADFEISNTTIRGITRADPYPAAIFYENRSPYSQSLRLTNVNLENNAHDGVQVFYLQGGPTTIEVHNCRIANNAGYGIVFPVDDPLTSVEILNSVFVGNLFTAIRGTDAYASGVPIRIENNVVIGNGINEYGTQPYGIHFSSGEVKIVGNTVINNGEVGIVAGGLENIEQCVLSNNLLVGHTEYGLFKSDDGAPVVAGNNFWSNGDETQELRYQGPEGRIYTVEDLQALGGTFITNINVEPGLIPSVYGQIDTLIYDSRSYRSKLVDAGAGFTPQMIASMVLCADTTDPRWYPIHSLSGDTLFILGDIREHAGSGSVYRLLNYHLSAFSQVIDAGYTTQTIETHDIDGDARIIDGDENGSMLVDIGADEFNYEDTSSIRVLQPSSEKLLVAYQSFAIEWLVPDSVASVDIDYNTTYDPANPDVGWKTIAAGTDATSNYYSWRVPGFETAMHCYIRVRSTSHPNLFGLSAPFKVKHLALTRIRNDSLIEYTHPDDVWPFENDSATMWPVEVWPSYAADSDPVTGDPYPDEFTNPTNAKSSDYPSWPTFVETFGVDACYFSAWNGHWYRPSAALRWGAIKEEWAGSCFGFTVTSLMAFRDSVSFAARPGIGPFVNLHSLAITDLRRDLVNRYYTYQFGQQSISHTDTVETRTANETLAEIRSMFCKLEASDSIRTITICDTSTVNNEGCHSLTPYALEKYSDDVWYLWVYDSNTPALASEIIFDTIANNWEYLDQSWEGETGCYLEDPLYNYANPAVMAAEMRAGPPVARAGGTVEIYPSAADSVQVRLGVGAIGNYGDSSFNDIPGARPIIPKIGAARRPIGYLLPEGNTSCRLTGVTDNQLHVTAFSDDLVMSYRRREVSSTDTDEVAFHIGGGVSLYSHAESRACDVDIVKIHSDRERLLSLQALMLSADDSASVELTDTEALRIVNYGDESSYDLLLRDVSGDGPLEFAHENLVLAANSSYQLEPDWLNLNDSLTIFVDSGNTGVFYDTIVVSNDSPTDIGDESDLDLPYRFELSQNYPNPFNPVTTIEYSLPERSHVTIEVYNILGQTVRTLVDREISAGTYRTVWDGTTGSGRRVASGVYLYRFKAGDHIETKKMLLLK